MRSKRLSSGINSRTARSFNSDTVRSKPFDTLCQNLCIVFQFRHGAIKTYRNYKTQIVAAKVSIPTRCDQNAFVVGFVLGAAVSFNSDTVRSKLLPQPARRSSSSRFNSDTVRSKLCRASVEEKKAMFQFRHGAIKTCVCYSALNDLRVFQFRHGAIKTVIKELEGKDGNCFNSDTVRSKRYTRFTRGRQ